MSVDARTEEFEHIELFGKPALFTNERIDRNTVPKGWYCYDFRGSDNDAGKLNTVEPRVAVNHSGAVLLPEEIDMKGKGYRRVRGQINFLGDELTLREFCALHGLECTVKEPQFHIRPARPDEVGFFYAQRQNMVQKLLIGRVTFAYDDTQEFTDAEEYLQCIRKELPYHATTGFRYETLTDDPTVRKAVDDILYDLYGEENPRPLEDYENKPEQGMTMGSL